MLNFNENFATYLMKTKLFFKKVFIPGFRVKLFFFFVITPSLNDSMLCFNSEKFQYINVRNFLKIIPKEINSVLYFTEKHFTNLKIIWLWNTKKNEK